MKLRAFIIDDEPRAVEFIREFLKNTFPAFEIVGTAPSIDDGFQKIRHAQPEILFLDLNLPRGNGLELLQRFPLRRFDVIVITAFVEVHKGYDQYGISAIITKPIDPDELRFEISKIIEARRQNPDKVFTL
ncbi:MAG: response regulator [Bacteroidales bacterium]|jgi:two-component system LytT family response regulator|nr:response regulator [Bacteroidales bacterium]